MYTDTEGIILKQLKIAGGRRMILLFSKKYGKISAGTDISEKGKKKSALAIRPFVYGRYELYKKRDLYYLNGGDVIQSHFAIGEDIDKYIQASYAVELTEKLLPEEAAAPELFLLLSDYLDMIEKRKQKYETLTLAYMAKILKSAGSEPELNRCVLCGEKENLTAFSVKEGGCVCSACRNGINSEERLIFEDSFGIIDVLKYLTERPLAGLEKLALDERMAGALERILKSWLAYHLDVSDLKSETFLLQSDYMFENRG